MKKANTLLASSLFAAAVLTAQTTIFDDTWADGGATDGADPNDTAWYKSTSGSALEVGTGFLGLVTGTSGRGIHTVFEPITLGVGDSLEIVATFNTPDTVGTDRSASLRLGFFNSQTASVAMDVTSSTDLLWDVITGYMNDYDVNTDPADVGFRQRLPGDGTRDRLLSTTANFEAVGDFGGETYSFFDNTPYTVTFTMTRTGEAEMTLSGSLAVGENVLTSHSVVDTSDIETTFDFLGLHNNSNSFGSVSDVDTPDNGIDFTRITLTLTEGVAPTTWRGYTVEAGDIVRAPDWIGTIYVGMDPWIYSYNINNWIYLAPASAEGAWGYFINP